MASKKRFISFLLMTMLVTSVPVSAGTEVVPALKLDATGKYPGDTIHITGKSPLGDVIVKIVRPDGVVLYFNAVKVEQGAYEAAITLPADAMPGSYTVIAGQGGLETSAKQTFTVAKKPDPGGNGGTPGNSGSNGGSGGSGNSDGTTPPTDPGTSPVTADGASITASVPASAVNITKVNENGDDLVKVTIDKTALTNAFQTLKAQSNDSGKKLVVAVAVPGRDDVDGAKVELPAEALKAGQSAAPNAFILIRSNGLSIELPLKAISIAGLESSLNAAASDINMVVTLQEMRDLFTEKDNQSMATRGIVAQTGPVSFNVSAVAKGNQVMLKTIGDGFIDKTLSAATKLDPKRSTAVAIDPVTHELRFVPSVFQASADGGTTVLIKQQSNEMYMIVTSNPSFRDTAGHWAKSSIEHLASKLIVNGVGSGAFSPDTHVSRAEFTAMLVRASGLSLESVSSGFKDVQADDWFAGAVQTAKARGWVNGMADGTFQPHAEVTREQMAVMVERFMAFSGSKPQSKPAELENRFKDSGDIGQWAKPSMELLVSSKLMEGVSQEKLAPKKTATRAEVVAILERFLRYAKLINE
ncbi:S-layer homology domain-containing protein [Paenibacillus spongiae]|uniref:S-layer homology domain-containing protein n=1 Tax=Paenibacillus spongiae TaxID=2909671 RepID=A0ABY5S1K3_9BACL|nr:S-layer homology domain-containing protein [Paenibacillus spongiae]UVI27741.1 S-layer homology domain-containing protein [Paenibacillus spongiae]